ncbi:MAG: hypothetical protein K1W05_01370 [Desulfovibrio sp.]|jgi:hypothetical protein
MIPQWMMKKSDAALPAKERARISQGKLALPLRDILMLKMLLSVCVMKSGKRSGGCDMQKTL